MAGLRVGWVIYSQAAIKALRRYHMFTTSVANTPAQFAGVAARNGDQQCVKDMVDIYRERRDKIVDLIDQTPYLTGYKPGGAFYAFPKDRKSIRLNSSHVRISYAVFCLKKKK